WELEIWDARLITEAQIIWEKREALLTYLKDHLTELYQEISGSKEKLKIVSQTHSDRYEEKLIAHQDSDIRMGNTTLGPHRDDFTIYIENRPLAVTGSRGECRSAVLAMKIAEIRYMQEQTGSRPLLLLDDVFSELDHSRQNKLGTLLGDYQCIITTTSKTHVKDLKDIKCYTVEKGSLTG
ncbi:hypothetical protein HOD30_05640, partial [Candidatus Peregrinibacteria bacterium]|nr:hypothetical protein [Candidatus Peregrinibacteria bacterium]